MRFQRWSVSFHYEISVTVSFVPLRDFKDGRFCSVMRVKLQSVLFLYKISMTVRFQCQSVKFVQLRDLNLFFYEIFMTVGSVPL